jgi:hypothetical protein
MGLLYINTGTSANSGNGDSIRLAFTKVNNNFSKLDTKSSPTFFQVTTTNLISSFGMIGTLTVSTLSITGQVITPVYFSSSGNFESLTVRQSAQVRSLRVADNSSFNDVIITGTIYGNLIFNGTATLGGIVISNGVSGLMTFTNINVVGNATFSNINNAGTYSGTAIYGTTITGTTIVGNDIFAKSLFLQDTQPVGVDFTLENMDVTGFNSIKMQDPQAGGLNIIRQNIGDDNASYLAGNTYIYGLTPADKINLGRYSDLNFYASNFNYYTPSAPNTASIQILAFDGRVVLNKDLYLKTNTIYFNSSSFTIDSFGTISVNGNTFLSGTAGPTGPVGPAGPTGATGLSFDQQLYTTSTVSFARILSTTATFTNITGTTATFTNLTGTTATFTNINGTTAGFTNLSGTTATFTNLNGTTATFTTISAKPINGTSSTSAQIGFIGKPQIVLQDTSGQPTIVTLSLDHQGKHLISTSTFGITVVLPTTAEVPLPIGSEVTIVYCNTATSGPGLVFVMNNSVYGIFSSFNLIPRERAVFISTSSTIITCLKIYDDAWFLK